MIGPIGAEEVAVGVLEEDVDGPLPPLDHRVASPDESGGLDALVEGEEEDGKHSATGATVTIVVYH